MAALLGMPFMPWQQQVADVALEIDPATGRLAYREVDLLVPRQSGKTTELLALMVHRATGFGRAQRIRYTAQTRNDARQKWEDDHLPILEASPFRRRFRKRLTNGNEAILWKGGSIHGLAASTEKAGHGPTLDLGVIDEAFAQVDSRLEQAFKPAMITRRDAQLWVVSTAGRSPGKSPYLWSKVEKGRAREDARAADGRPSRVAYFEWSAHEDAERGDPATWWGCMPALGHTIELEAIEADFESMDPAEFDRAYLNRWNPHAVDAVIPTDDWHACVSELTAAVNPVWFAFDVSPDRAHASIGVAGAAVELAGGVHVEVIENRPGTGWVIDRLVEVRDRHHPAGIVCDPAGPAGGLLAEAKRKGIDLVLAGTRDHTQACGALFDDVVGHRLRHRGQPVLEAAAAGASKRNVADAWLWSRTSSSVDISPLVAVTLAAWGHRRPVEAEEPLPTPGYYGGEDDFEEVEHAG